MDRLLSGLTARCERRAEISELAPTVVDDGGSCQR